MIDFSRIQNINPLVWVVLIIAALLGYGAKKFVSLMKFPEEKQPLYVAILKGGALLLAVLDFVYLLIRR